MIYQFNSEFRIFKYSTTFKGKVFHLDDKEQFENTLKELLQQEEDMKAIEEGREPVDISILPLVYEDVSLTEEQLDRFNAIKDVKDITLDDVRDYTLNNVDGDSIAFQNYKMQKRIVELEDILAGVIGGVM